NVIVGYGDLLLEGAFGALGGEQAEVVRRANARAWELLDLIDATLDLSRLDARHVPVERQALLLADLIDEIATEFPVFRKKPALRLVWTVPPGLPWLTTDRLKLKMVLKNLIGNAIKFTDLGGVTVDARSSDDGVEIAVTDTGIGIPPEVQPIIFEPFRQADGSSTRRHGGVGLGLHIARRLLDLLGGTLTLESEVGRGSTFRVYLPVDDVAEVEPTHAERRGSAALRTRE